MERTCHNTGTYFTTNQVIDLGMNWMEARIRINEMDIAITVMTTPVCLKKSLYYRPNTDHFHS